MSPTLIIAEAGVNHNGRLDIGLKLVDAAVHAGADVIKFQTYNAQSLVTPYAAAADYQLQNQPDIQNQLTLLKGLELSEDDHVQLLSYCQKRGIEFLSSAFDLKSIEQLVKLKPFRWKIPSGEITNIPYLRSIGAKSQPVILSTGMSNLGDIECAINELINSGTPRDYITVLHCTTQYPAPLADVNLRAMTTIHSALDVSVGYSDHTDGIAVPIAAVALGASVIEKHLTLDRSMNGPDHQASLEPTGFRSMVDSIRSVELALGSSLKRLTSSEHANSRLVRKSIVASQIIKAGEIFTTGNLTTKRPGTGISPLYWDDLIGQTSTRDYLMDQMIEFS